MDNHLKLIVIKQLIAELQNSIEKLDENHQQIYRIDLDLALEKIRKIYDDLLSFKLSDNKETAAEIINIVEQETSEETLMVEKQQAESVAQQKPPNEPDQSAEMIAKPKQNNEETILKENLAASMDLFSATIIHEKTTEKNIIVENVAEKKPIEIVAEKFGKKKISGLNQAIGINEKFFFINELFDGNMKEYKVSIDALDQAENIETAKEFLESLATKNNWDKTGEAFKVILDFIERKFL